MKGDTSDLTSMLRFSNTVSEYGFGIRFSDTDLGYGFSIRSSDTVFRYSVLLSKWIFGSFLDDPSGTVRETPAGQWMSAKGSSSGDLAETSS